MGPAANISPVERQPSRALEGMLVVDMNPYETMNVGLGRTSLVVAASDGPGG